VAKKYEAKVYDEDGDYLTTWKDVVSNIQYSNEINSAGGQLTLTLARNAGDYGEGTDVDFNYKVKVYCFDKEEPHGQVIFQGYISAYTPIYKDNNVEITVLSYGAELTDYIIEAGETLDFSQTTTVGSYYFGNFVTPSETNTLAQVVTAVGNGSWGSIILKLRTVVPYSYQRVRVIAYQGSAASNSYTLLGTSNTVTVVDSTSADYTFSFPDLITYTNATQYVFQLDLVDLVSGSGVYNLALYATTPSAYSGGALYAATN
jgi:hypothetical protein